MSKNDSAPSDKAEEKDPSSVSIRGDNWIAFGLFLLFMALCVGVYLMAQWTALPGAPGAPVGVLS